MGVPPVLSVVGGGAGAGRGYPIVLSGGVRGTPCPVRGMGQGWGEEDGDGLGGQPGGEYPLVLSGGRGLPPVTPPL